MSQNPASQPRWYLARRSSSQTPERRFTKHGFQASKKQTLMSSARSLLPSVQPTKPVGHARKVRKGRREVPVGSREDSGNFYKTTSNGAICYSLWKVSYEEPLNECFLKLSVRGLSLQHNWGTSLCQIIESLSLGLEEALKVIDQPHA